MKKLLLLICIILFSQVANCEEMTKSQEALVFYNDNNLEKAYFTLLLIEENDRVAQDWFLLGNILADKKKMDDAIFMYKRAILVDEKFYKPYYNLANMYLDDEKCFMAITNYKLAIKHKSDFAYAYYNLGCAYLKLGQLRKAKSAILKAITIKNDEPDFRYNLAYIYKKLNKEKAAKAELEIYNKLIANPN